MPKFEGPGKQKMHAYIVNVSTELKLVSKGQKCKYCNEIFSSINNYETEEIKTFHLI